MFGSSRSNGKQSAERAAVAARTVATAATERAERLIKELQDTDPEKLEVKAAPDTVVTPFETRRRS